MAETATDQGHEWGYVSSGALPSGFYPALILLSLFLPFPFPSSEYFTRLSVQWQPQPVPLVSPVFSQHFGFAMS